MKSKWKTPRPTKGAPEIIFYILILWEKWWSIHKLLIPWVKLLNFLAHKNQIFWDLLELNNETGVAFLVFIWLLDHRQDTTHFSTSLLARLPSGVTWLDSLKDGWGPSAPENNEFQREKKGPQGSDSFQLAFRWVHVRKTPGLQNEVLKLL